MFMELEEVNGARYVINLDSICAVAFSETTTTIYMNGKPFIALTEGDVETFTEWYNAQEKFKRHPVDVKPLEVKKTGKQKQEKENDKTD